MSHPSDSNPDITPLPLSPGGRRAGSEDDTSPGTPTPVGVEAIPFVDPADVIGEGETIAARARALTPGGTRRVGPNPGKPRVSDRKERKLAPADALSAQGYDALEIAGESVKLIWRDVAEVIAVDAPPALKPMGDDSKETGGGQR